MAVSGGQCRNERRSRDAGRTRRELAEIAALLERARAGEGGVLLLEGPPGIGKSALLGAAAAAAARDRVLRGRGGDVERDLGFGLVRELFEAPLRAASDDQRTRWLAGAARPAGAVLGAGQEGMAGDAASVAYALYWLLAAIADEGPVVLLADDLQWCDVASLRWLIYLARRIDGLAVALVASCRLPEPVEQSLVQVLAGERELDRAPARAARTRRHRRVRR